MTLSTAWRFSTSTARAQNAGELIKALDEIFATRSRDDWASVFDAEEDFWWAPVQTFTEVLADPQVHASGGLVEVPDEESTTLLPATPADFEGTPCRARWMAPSPGQHTDLVLAETGRNAQAIANLRDLGVLG